MALKLVTAAEMKEIDRITIEQCGVPGLELMERAGTAVAHEIQEVFDPEAIGIVCGKGNNAGDGLVVARYLADDGKKVIVLLLADAEGLSEGGKANLECLPESVQVLSRDKAPELQTLLGECDVLVDAIFGTGISGAVRGSLGEAIALMNGLGKPIVAIDIPSGLNADTGEAEGACIEADLTVTIGLPKIGMIRGDGPRLCGKIKTVDIGFSEDLTGSSNFKVHLLAWKDVRNVLPARPLNGHKGTFGSLLVIAGGRGYSGAAYLSTSTALRSGCGMVYAAFPESVLRALESQIFEAIKIPLPEVPAGFLSHEAWDMLEPVLQKADAIALGPGIGTQPETRRLVDEIVCQDIPIVIDADGLNCLAEKVDYLTKRGAPTIITPHPGEMARLTGRSIGDIQSDRISAAQQLADEAQIIVVLKGSRTVIAEPAGRVFINPTGNSGMAKGGSGDVLTGLIGGLLAQGCSAMDAACAGVYLHGLAGDYARERFGERGMLPRDIMEDIPWVLQLCDEVTDEEDLDL